VSRESCSSAKYLHAASRRRPLLGPRATGGITSGLAAGSITDRPNIDVQLTWVTDVVDTSPVIKPVRQVGGLLDLIDETAWSERMLCPGRDEHRCSRDSGNPAEEPSRFSSSMAACGKFRD
jgi:hypothetical protein